MSEGRIIINAPDSVRGSPKPRLPIFAWPVRVLSNGAAQVFDVNCCSVQRAVRFFYMRFHETRSRRISRSPVR